MKAGHEGKGDRPSRTCPQHHLPGRLKTRLGGSLLPIVLRDWWGYESRQFVSPQATRLAFTTE